jgi:hypothetical protein
VGTSGMSTEPHLHMHVTDPTGAGVPMVFAGRRRPPRRNDVLRAAPADGQPGAGPPAGVPRNGGEGAPHHPFPAGGAVRG